MVRRIGVCSWSLLPRTVDELASRAHEVGVHAVQLALEPLRTGRWSVGPTRAALATERIEIASAMMEMHGEDYSSLESIRVTGGLRPDSTWAANESAARDNARIARELGLTLVTFHAGFLPHDRGDAERVKLIERLRTFADVFAAAGVRVGLETGQESPETLLDVLAQLDRPNVGVNFDPANLILYGTGDPVAALAQLAARVVQIHVKDARAAKRPGTWGEEVQVGTGDVDWDGIHDVMVGQRIGVDLMIEREAGTDRVGDARRARAMISSLVS